MPNLSRRTILLAPFAAAAAKSRLPRVAVVLNAYFPNSHADVFVGRLLEGYRLNGVSHRPRLQTASLYVDQLPVNDMAREQAEEYGAVIFPDVASALRLGGKKLAVDGIAVIGEHGDYPRTPRGNVMYPRRQRFDEVTQVMRDDGRVVPLFNDKYFAYEWDDARHMYETVKRMRIPFFCGSSLPHTWRRPALEFEPGIDLDEVLAVSFSDLEEHAYHAIELMQAMAEKRRGGETGVASIRCVEGEEVWRLGRAGEWSRELLDAALSRRINRGYGNEAKKPQAILIRYEDGLRGTILNLDGMTRDYLFASRTKAGAIQSSCFYIQLFVHNHWGFMVRAFEDLVLTGKNPTPIERTYLSTGILLFGLESRLRGQKWLNTPQLSSISY